jgi:uncharacterized membrane protein
MTRGTLRAILVTAVCASMGTLIEYAALPQAVRIIPGLLMVFFLPGFATVCAVLPARDMSGGERLLASLGVSMVITVCVSVLLGATVGLSQRSAAVALGGLTLVACFFALLRERRAWRSFKDLHEWHH